jgi:hypothetical protein
MYKNGIKVVTFNRLKLTFKISYLITKAREMMGLKRRAGYSRGERVRQTPATAHAPA